MSNKKDALWFIIYKIVLDLTYVYIHKDVYAYYGFGFQPSITKKIISWSLFIFVVICISSKKVNCRTIFLYTTMCLGLTPVFVYYEYNIEAKTWMLISQVAMLLIMYLLMNKISIFSNIRIKKISNSSRAVSYLAGLILVAYFLYAFIEYGMPSLDALSFENIYEIRENVELSTITSIIQNFVCRVLVPILMMILFFKKKWLLFCLVLAVQLYTYAITGFKTFLFIPLVVMALMIFHKIDINRLMLRALPIVCICCSLIYVLFDKIYPYALINERVLFLPAKIKFAYFDYFSQHEFSFFSQTTIGSLLGIESSYQQPIPNLIGSVYFNRPEMWTNTGFMADAYSNMGIAGMFLISIFLSMVLSFIDASLKNNDPKLNRGVLGMFLLFFISLNDGSAITVFFSGGMIFALLIVCLISFKSKELIANEKRDLKLGPLRTHSEKSEGIYGRSID